MNQQQSDFILRAMQQLTQVVDQCAENSATASAILGRRTVGRHIVVVRIVAELDEGFSAPLNSHASRGRSATTQSAIGQSVANQPGSNQSSTGQSSAGQSSTGRSGASHFGRSSTIEPDYSKYTKHHNKSNRVNRWHKPIFDL